MIKKSVWLCALLAAFAAVPVARAQEINSWEDLLPLIEGRGEEIVRRLELVPGGPIDLGRSVNANYYIRRTLRELSEQGATRVGSGQLLEVSLTHEGLYSDGQALDPDRNVHYVSRSLGGDPGEIRFTPVRYLEDSQPSDILKFYVYFPSVTLSDPRDTLRISYVAPVDTDGFGSYRSVLPGCFKVRTGRDEIDSGDALRALTDQTCPLLSAQISPEIADWDIRNGLTGPGWLRANLREGQNEFEGLILVLQPKGAFLDLSRPAPCDSVESGCGEVVENYVSVVPDLIERANASRYYALAVGPVHPVSGAQLGSVVGSLENSAGDTYAVTTEQVFAPEGGRGIYTLSLPPALSEGDYPGVSIAMSLSSEFEGQDCTANVSFVEGFSELAAPAIFNCVDDGMVDDGIVTDELPQISETVLPAPNVGNENPEGDTLQLRTALVGLTPSITNVGGNARTSSIENGACAGYDGSAQQDEGIQLFCLSGDLGSEKLTFNYETGEGFLAYLGPTNEIENMPAVEGGATTSEIIAPFWTISPSSALDFTLQLIGDGVSPAFWNGLSVNASLVLDAGGNISPIDFEVTIDEVAQTVKLAMPAQVLDPMLADFNNPVFRIDVITAVGVLSESEVAESLSEFSSPYFPQREEESETISFFLSLGNLLATEELVVPLDVRIRNFRFANQSIRVWADIPKARQVPTPCSIGIRIDAEDYWLSPNADRTSFTFPPHFPEVSGGDILTIVARPVEGIASDLGSPAEKLCPEFVEEITEVSVLDINNTDTIYVPLGRAVLAYFLRTATSDDEYGTRNNSEIYRVGFAPVLNLQQDRIVAFFRPIRGGARSFEAFNRISGISPFVDVDDVEGRVATKLNEIMDVRNIPDGDVSIEKALRDAVLARQKFGLSGPFWPDIVILASGNRPFTCKSIDAALYEVEIAEELDGIGASNATLSIYYDSFNPLDSGRTSEVSTCETGSRFGKVNLFKTSLSGLFNSGRGRYDQADVIQGQWNDVVRELAERVED